MRIRKPRRLRGSERISEKPCAPVTQTRVKKDDTGRKVGRRRSKGGALMAHRRGEASVMDSNYYLFDLFFTHPSKREIFPFRDVSDLFIYLISHRSMIIYIDFWKLNFRKRCTIDHQN